MRMSYQIVVGVFALIGAVTVGALLASLFVGCSISQGPRTLSDGTVLRVGSTYETWGPKLGVHSARVYASLEEINLNNRDQMRIVGFTAGDQVECDIVTKGNARVRVPLSIFECPEDFRETERIRQEIRRESPEISTAPLKRADGSIAE